jgi:hypothetical protein
VFFATAYQSEFTCCVEPGIPFDCFVLRYDGELANVLLTDKG